MSRPEIQHLREQLRRKAPFIGHVPADPTGWSELDEALGGGLPRGALTVVTGPAGGGRITLAGRVLATSSGPSRPVAWVDGRKDLYPPALMQLGLPLERLLLVRSDVEGAMAALEQIVSSGLFAAVAAWGLDRWLEPARVRRIQTGVEGARGRMMWVCEPDAAARIPGAALRLRVERGSDSELQVRIEKDRSGHRLGQTFRVRAAPRSPSGIHLSTTVDPAPPHGLTSVG